LNGHARILVPHGTAGERPGQAIVTGEKQGAFREGKLFVNTRDSSRKRREKLGQEKRASRRTAGKRRLC